MFQLAHTYHRMPAVYSEVLGLSWHAGQLIGEFYCYCNLPNVWWPGFTNLSVHVVKLDQPDNLYPPAQYTVTL